MWKLGVTLIYIFLSLLPVWVNMNQVEELWNPFKQKNKNTKYYRSQTHTIYFTKCGFGLMPSNSSPLFQKVTIIIISHFDIWFEIYYLSIIKIIHLDNTFLWAQYNIWLCEFTVYTWIFPASLNRWTVSTVRVLMRHLPSFLLCCSSMFSFSCLFVFK